MASILCAGSQDIPAFYIVRLVTTDWPVHMVSFPEVILLGFRSTSTLFYT